MLFNSQAYLLFLGCVLTLYWLIPIHRMRTLLLVGSSYFFYAQWSQQLALLVACTTILDYLFARGMDSFRSTRVRKLLLSSSLCMNLGLLCYFKYTNFFLDSLRSALSSSGFSASIPTLEILIPFGISFYTFEAISYAIDVYRRKIPAEKDLLHFMLFILFFPHLVAGPIVRGGDFLPQVRKVKRWNWFRAELGVQLLLLGFLKKVIADRMAMFSDPVFSAPAEYNSLNVWFGVLAFMLRIYFDFSGYSDMALGSAHLLGFKLTKNFNLPYLSLNVAEFWRRWHISLSTWLRDYVFIPLGGSKTSEWKLARNLMITMLLGGLWHGANWSFVIWGGVHGMLLVIHRQFRNWVQPRTRLKNWLETHTGIALRWLLTFFTILISWVFFQPSLATSMEILHRMFHWIPGNAIPLPRQSLWLIYLGVACAHLLIFLPWLRKSTQQIPAPILGIGYALFFSLTLMLVPPTSKTFIYFTF